MDLGLSIFGLPVRGLTQSPHFLCTTKYSIHYVFQKVNRYSAQILYFCFVAFPDAFELRCATYFDTEENAEKAAEILNKELTSRRFG